jgi:hypothetical protein
MRIVTASGVSALAVVPSSSCGTQGLAIAGSAGFAFFDMRLDAL